MNYFYFYQDSFSTFLFDKIARAGEIGETEHEQRTCCSYHCIKMEQIFFFI